MTRRKKRMASPMTMYNLSVFICIRTTNSKGRFQKCDDRAASHQHQRDAGAGEGTQSVFS
jgi:hypothetical protein